MKEKPIVRFSAITLLFVVLVVGVIFFSEKSLESSGRKNADIVVQMIEDGDIDGVIAKLDEFVGEVNPNDQGYIEAINSLRYVSEAIQEDGSIVFESGELVSRDEYRVFSAVYSIPEPQGGKDYLVVVLRRDEGVWLLANTKLAAVNPLSEN